jgi:hypothetical protein
VPTLPGGGTVAYVNPTEQQYLTDPVTREEGGTPNIVGSIRAGLVFGLKQAVGTELIRAREEHFWRRALESWEADPNIWILGDTHSARLSIVSLVIRHGDRYLHHNFVVGLLNDLFGIQSRGGCSCAGPYGHRLLGIDLDRSHAFQREITRGCEGIKPGWTRLSFNYFISEPTADYLIAAVHLIAAHGHRLLPDYHFDPATGLWRHRAGVTKPPLRLTDLHYDPDGRPRYARRHARAGDDALAGYLEAARSLFASRPTDPGDAASGLAADFEELRWFALPKVCLRGPDDDA